MNIVASLLYYRTPEDERFWRDITDFSIGTYGGKLQGDWEYRTIEVPGHLPQDEIFFRAFCQIHDWWEEGHNVFYTNVDTIAVQPFEVFDGRYPRLWMWWPTDPPSAPRLPVFFNCGNAYFPATMSRDIWEYGFDEYRAYFDGPSVPWAADQYIYNYMLYHQGQPPSAYLDNTMHWYARSEASHLNAIPESEAKIVHYFTTRGKEWAFDQMRTDYARLTGGAP